MKRIPIPESEACPHFIGCWQIEQPSLCAALIAFFDANSDKHTRGKTAGGLNPEAKNSIDLSIRPRELEREDHKPLRDYLEALFACHQDYLEQWPFLKTFLGRVDIGSFNLQKYEPGGHFMKVHSERTTVGTAHRVLAWMSYLNDVEDGGETRFVHQGLDISPRQGKTLIWPAEWTHAHQGRVLNSGEKYIITGWMHFSPDRG